jgi:hypothetical protein
MGTRKDGDDKFIFPNTTHGLVTVCPSGTATQTKAVWKPTDAAPGVEIHQENIVYASPYFEDPPCRWRLQDETGNTLEFPPEPLVDNETLTPKQKDKSMDPEEDDRQSPPNCRDFCIFLNRFKYHDCLDVGKSPPDPAGNQFDICLRWGDKYICSDKEVIAPNGICEDSANSPEPANSRTCQGKDCRCQGNGGPIYNGCKTDGNGHNYFSYYRHYDSSYTRDAVPSDGPADDTTRSSIPIACYGFYNEFDPKFHQTQGGDRRCVIKVDVGGMFQSQMGKGEYGQNSEIEDTDPIATENQRVKDEDAKDIWFMKLGWGFSLLKEESFEEDYGRDLSNVFLDIDNLDKASMTASWPIAKTDGEKRLAISDTLRAFDETGEKRIIASWWQKNQTEVAVLVHPPIVRLILPPGYSFGADPTDPLFATQSSSTSSADDVYQKRNVRIEVQLDAKDDILGEVLAFVERSFLLHIEEDPVPVLVPMGSPTEFRAKAQEWCTWYMHKTGANDCTGAPSDVLDVISKLNSYADDIENVRTLRIELALYAGKILKIQEELTKPLSDWMTENLTAYLQYLQQQQATATAVTNSWRQAREAMNRFHDKTNAPWCMNQRFETPVYSLLDGWLPSRAYDGNVDGNISADNLPSLNIPRAQDFIIDFSEITYMTGSFKIPVLKPVQVKINIPSPPSVLFEDTNIEDPLPDLPSIADIRDAIDQTMEDLPDVQASESYPPIELPPITSFGIATSTIQGIHDVIDQMNDRYDRFWKSISPLNQPCKSSGDCSGDETCQPTNVCYDTGEDSIEVRKNKLECKEWDDETCQHVEMDLMERLQRIGSRKLVILKEDYDSKSERRSVPDACMPEDEACYLLHGEKAQPKYQWEIHAPSSMPNLGAKAREKVRSVTLPTPIGDISTEDFPPYDVNVNDLLPFYDVPLPYVLTPPKS